MAQSRHRSYRRSHGMQGGDSDPTSFGQERRYDDSLDSIVQRQNKEAMSNKVIYLTNQISSSIAISYWLYKIAVQISKI